MGIDPEVATLAGIAPPRLGPDGLTPEVRAYQDGIEIHHVRFTRTYDCGTGERLHDRSQVGDYTRDGSFAWGRCSFAQGPEWLAEAVGGKRVAIRECVSEDREGGCRCSEIVRHENRGPAFVTTLRGVALRYRDHSEAVHDAFVRCQR